MQVKKFEAPTIQEALETIKRELGPEAIILQTKSNKRGFGLMSKASVEVTAAVSERSMHKKQHAETRLPEPTRKQVDKMGAERQAEFYDEYLEKSLKKTQDRVEVRANMAAKTDRAPTGLLGGIAKRLTGGSTTEAAPAAKKITTTRYIDIDADERPAPANGQAAGAVKAMAIAQAKAQAAAQAEKNPLGMSVQEELTQLKRMIGELKGRQDETLGGSGAQALLGSKISGGSLGTPALQDAFEQLVVNGIDKRYALAILRKVGFDLGPERSKNPDDVLDGVAGEIMTTTETVSPLDGVVPAAQRSPESARGPRVIALVGPTGVGKTTTVAKMASEALLRRGLKVGLINLDSYKVAAFDQLATYAKILNVPFRSASTAEDLKSAIRDFGSLDLVLIDTTGRSQRDPGSLKEMQSLLEVVPEMDRQLVLAATTRDAELYDMATRFATFRPLGIIVSKLDEATTYGCIYNVSQKVKLPLIYFTTGQRVPEDIEEASQERLVSLVMDL